MKQYLLERRYLYPQLPDGEPTAAGPTPPPGPAPMPSASPLPLTDSPPRGLPPALPDATEADDATQPCAALRQGARLLLAEDDDVAQQLTGAMLRGLGLQVDVAADGQDALALARLQVYDLVLMDLRMPRLDGLQATRLIRALPGWQGVPIIALTGEREASDVAACLAAGMNGHLPKPAPQERLLAVLAQWLPAN